MVRWSYELFQRDGPLKQRRLGQDDAGLSTRNCGAVVRSAVSENSGKARNLRVAKRLGRITGLGA